MDLISPNHYYHNTTESQHEIVAYAETPAPHHWRDVDGRLKTALSR